MKFRASLSVFQDEESNTPCGIHRGEIKCCTTRTKVLPVRSKRGQTHHVGSTVDQEHYVCSALSGSVRFKKTGGVKHFVYSTPSFEKILSFNERHRSKDRCRTLQVQHPPSRHSSRGMRLDSWTGHTSFGRSTTQPACLCFAGKSMNYPAFVE